MKEKGKKVEEREGEKNQIKRRKERENEQKIERKKVDKKRRKICFTKVTLTKKRQIKE